MITVKPPRRQPTATSASSRTGPSLSFVVFIVFFVLKMTGVQPVAAWSWWWVTAPLWGGMLLTLLFGLTIGFVRALR